MATNPYADGLLASAGISAEDFVGPIEVYSSELTGRVVVVTRSPYGQSEGYFGPQFPFRVTHDTGNENIIYFFDRIGD